MSHKRKLGALATAVLLLSGCGPPVMCIVEGTRLETPQGPTAVQDLEIGDLVYSANPTSGELQVGRIARIRSGWRRIALLETDRGERIRLTPGHPVLADWGGGYEPVSDLSSPGRSHVAVLHDGQGTRSEARVRTAAGWRRVYDLTVDSQFRNFIAGGVVLHNKLPPPDDRIPAPIQDLAADPVDSASATLTWSAPDGRDGAPDVYSVGVKEDNGSPAYVGWVWTDLQVTPGSVGAGVDHMITDLKPGTAYLAKVRSSYSSYALWSGDSNVAGFSTPAGAERRRMK